MPSDRVPNNESNVAKPLSVEDFKKLKIGDKIWFIPRIIDNPYRGMIGPVSIHKISQPSSKKDSTVELLLDSNMALSAPASVKDLVYENDIFLSEKDAKEKLKRESELN